MALFFIIAAIFAIPLAQDAGAQAGVTMTIAAGFDRFCKEGHWIPLRVTLENNGPDLEGRLEARLGTTMGNEVVYSAPVTLPTISRKEFRFYVYPQGYLSEIPVRLVVGGKILLEQKVRINCLSTADSLFGVWAGSASNYSVLADLDPANGTATVAELETGDIPESSPALEALDVLLIADTDTGALTSRQRSALTAWVAQGGRLWIAGGPGWQKTAAGLGELLPLVPEGALTVDDLDALQNLNTTGDALEGSLVVATGELAAGAKVQVSSAAGEAGLPLIIRKQIGAGEVVYLAADPGLDPLKGWDGVLELYRGLLPTGQNRPGWASGFQDWYLASQAAATLPSMNLPSGFLICGLVGLYILAIGPLNYLVLRKMKRRELAWASIPLLVVVFSGMAFLFGSRLRGSLPILNRLAIVHLEAGSPQAQVFGLLGVYSPDRKSYQVETGENFLMHPLPNNEGNQGWSFSMADGTMSIPDLRVDIGGIVPLALEGGIPAPAIDHDLSFHVQEPPGREVRLQGTITNRSSISLRGAVLLAPGIAKPLDEIQPGETVTVDLSFQRAARAASAGQGNVYAPVTPGFPSPPYYFVPDTTIEDILGTTTYWDDKDNYRRYAMVASALNANMMGANRGGGVYLSGWAETSPLEVALRSSNGGSPLAVDTLDTTLYLVTLTPAIPQDEDRVVFSPGLFTWTALDSDQYTDITPYGTNLATGSYAFQFDPAQPVSFSRVASLTLHLETTPPNDQGAINVYLWSWQEGSWEQIRELSGEDTPVRNPERFVGPAGGVRLRIENVDPTQGSVQIERSDFTLVVER